MANASSLRFDMIEVERTDTGVCVRLLRRGEAVAIFDSNIGAGELLHIPNLDGHAMVPTSATEVPEIIRQRRLRVAQLIDEIKTSARIRASDE